LSQAVFKEIYELLDFSFSEEQNMLRSLVKDFGRKELAPGYKDRVKAKRSLKN
jgi:hypothetical protein